MKTNYRASYANYYKRVRQLAQKPEAKVSGLISLTIFAVAFFGIFAILPTFQTIASLSKEIEDAELVNSKLSKKIKSLDQAEEIYGQTVSKLKTINQVLPEEAEFERLAWQLHWLANDKKLTVAGGNFGEFMVKEKGVKSDKEVLELSIELTAQGSYEQIKEFLEEAVKIDRLIAIKEVSISKKKLKTDSGNIAANIRLTAYYLPIMEIDEVVKK